DALRARAQQERLADRPRLHVAFGDRADRLAPTADAVAMKGRQKQLALPHVRRLIEGQQRVRAEGRFEHGRVGLPGPGHRWIGAEDLSDELGVGYEDP